jgi:hypothetical protein
VSDLSEVECDNCVRRSCRGTCEQAGQQYMPHSTEDVHAFEEVHCSSCARDKIANGQRTMDNADDADLCDILAAGFAGEAKEWQYRADGKTVCTGYTPLNEPGLPRCPHTLELPL